MISKFGVENKNVIEALLERLTMIDSPNFTYRNIKRGVSKFKLLNNRGWDQTEYRGRIWG